MFLSWLWAKPAHRVVFDQEHSLAARLMRAGIRHGQAWEDVVLEGVGVRVSDSEIRFSFCPAYVILAGKRISADGTDTMALPHVIRSCRASIKSLAAVAKDLTQRCQSRAFVDLNVGELYCNGAMHLSNVEVIARCAVGDKTDVSTREAYGDHLAAPYLNHA